MTSKWRITRGRKRQAGGTGSSLAHCLSWLRHTDDAPCWCCCSHIKRIVLATKETTVTHQVSHRPIKCQSRLWSQRGTKVNGSHCGDNPLLRLTGIQIATKRYATLQAMAPTNIKTFHQTHIHAARLFLLFSFPCSADHERDWPPCKVVFSGWQPIR